MISSFQEFPTKILYAFLTSPIYASWPAYLILPELITLSPYKSFIIKKVSKHVYIQAQIYKYSSINPIDLHLIPVELTKFYYLMELLWLCFVSYQSWVHTPWR